MVGSSNLRQALRVDFKTKRLERHDTAIVVDFQQGVSPSWMAKHGKSENAICVSPAKVQWSLGMAEYGKHVEVGQRRLPKKQILKKKKNIKNNFWWKKWLKQKVLKSCGAPKVWGHTFSSKVWPHAEVTGNQGAVALKAQMATKVTLEANSQEGWKFLGEESGHLVLGGLPVNCLFGL